MNLKEIEKKYPNAHSFLWEDQEFAYDISIRDNIRNLYDFFDEQNITVTIWYNPIMWSYSIHDHINPGAYSFDGFKTRKEAEQAAFEKAFEILETNLK